MYRSQIDSGNNDIQKVRIFQEDNIVRCAQVFELWQSNASFRDFFVSTLKNAPFEAFQWETPPVTADSINQVFECVVLDSPYLPHSADPTAFNEYFQVDQHKHDEIVIFPNLGKDAILVVPTPKGSQNTYAHMASFLRGASSAQIHALWIAIGETILKKIGQEPLWLNTAGGGVPWLHVRLDARPKYYRYRPYKIKRIRNEH